ncbi:MAG: hypothetical protein JNL01_15470 [Bdellovibrionales bacterium]|nr:hypothetical protein [Bdellovibrionales bacterium]
MKRWLKKTAADLWKGWVGFAFQTESAHRYRLFEIFFPIVLFSHYITLVQDLDFFYGPQGLVTPAKIDDMIEMSGRFSILMLNSSMLWVWTCYLIFLGSLLCIIFGKFQRVAAAIALALHVSFIHRNVSIAFGMDLISIFFLFYLIFGAGVGHVKVSNWKTELRSLGLRFAQLQLCVIYAYSGIEKLKGISWWRGEAMWLAISNPQLGRIDVTWLSHFPFLIVLGTYLPLVWEVYFPAIIWIPAIRKWVLGFGVLFHALIAVTMSLPHFGVVMVSLYVLFLTEDEAAKILEWLKSKQFELKKRLRAAVS